MVGTDFGPAPTQAPDFHIGRFADQHSFSSLNRGVVIARTLDVQDGPALWKQLGDLLSLNAPNVLMVRCHAEHRRRVAIAKLTHIFHIFAIENYPPYFR